MASAKGSMKGVSSPDSQWKDDGTNWGKHSGLEDWLHRRLASLDSLPQDSSSLLAAGCPVTEPPPSAPSGSNAPPGGAEAPLVRPRAAAFPQGPGMAVSLRAERLAKALVEAPRPRALGDVLSGEALTGREITRCNSLPPTTREPRLLCYAESAAMCDALRVRRPHAPPCVLLITVHVACPAKNPRCCLALLVGHGSPYWEGDSLQSPQRHCVP
jgi:hypothetical protein